MADDIDRVAHMGKKAKRVTPLWSRSRSPVLVAIGLGGLTWLGFTGFPVIGLVPLVALVIVGAVLFSRRDEPSRRLERLIRASRRDR